MFPWRADYVHYHPDRMYAPLNQDSLLKDSFKSVAWSAIDLNLNLFHWDSLKVFVATFPIYAAARMADEKLSHCFINRRLHRNKHQMSEFGHQFGQYAIAFPCFIGACLSVAARDPDVRQTSRMFCIGFPFVYLVSHALLKKFDYGCAGLRPWCEFFSRHKRSPGGLPSGHMALYSYAAFLYGLRFGPKYALPFGALAAFSGIALINCNRHYASQIVAGAGLGALYALAVSKTVDKKLGQSYECSLDLDHKGQPAVKMAYKF
jgi:hypothetical protein